MRRAWVPGTVLLLAVAGCEQRVSFNQRTVEADDLAAQIQVEPTAYDFGARTSKDAATATFTVTNTGPAVLLLDDAFLSGDADAFTMVPSTPLPVELASGASWTFDTTFRAALGGELTAEVLLRSNSETDPEVAVPLVGTGALPNLLVTPDPVDFGTVSVPCERHREVTLENTGLEPVRIDAVRLAGPAAASLSLVSPVPAGLELAQNQTYTVKVGLTASLAGAVAGFLEVDSSDPRGTQSVQVSGTTRFIVEEETQLVTPSSYPVYFIFAVDQSGSMNDDQLLLGNNIGAFANVLNNAQMDWRVGVLTGAGSPSGACFVGGNWLDSTLAPATFSSQFASRVQVGSDGSYLTEALIGLVDQGIKLDAPGECNAGFHNRDGELHIVFISDERDQTNRVGGGVWLGGYAQYVVNWRNYIGAQNTLVVHSIVDIDVGGGDCGGASGDDGPGGYIDVAGATGGNLLDLCTSNWSQALAGIAQRAVSTTDRIRLDHPSPVVSTIVVYEDGVPVTTGWRYDAPANAIVFDSILPADTAYRVTYALAPTCPPP